MNIDYNDERFQNVEKEKNARLKEVSKTYDNMIKQSDKYYDKLSDAAENYGKQQQELQQQRTDFTIDQINQNKEWAKQDYTKEQKGAYQDYRKESNQYGVNAEQMAQNGLLDTGYAESSRVSMYNTYQNRVATARESYNRAVVDYDNQIKDAQLQNNSVLAELAYNTLKTKLEYSLQGFQYKNSLIQQQLTAENDVDDRYYNRWKDVLNQMNTDRAFAYQQQRDAVADSQWQKQYNLSLAKVGGSGGGGSNKTKGASNLNGNSNTDTHAADYIDAKNGVNNDAMYSSTMSPASLSKKSYDWYTQNFSKSMSLGEIEDKLAQGLADNKLNKADVNNIYKIYNVKKTYR